MHEIFYNSQFKKYNCNSTHSYNRKIWVGIPYYIIFPCLTWVKINFEWYEDAMVFRIFLFILFCLTTPVRKYISMRTTSVTVVMIFRKCHSESYWSQLCWKFVLSNYKPHWQQPAFRKTPNSWRFYGYRSFLSGEIIMKQISTKVPRKLHKNLSLHFEEHFTNIEHDISHFLNSSFSVQQT